MRIITGTARGTRLLAPEGEDVTRPTIEKAKEAIFSSIQFDIEGRDALDLFAGSGQLGLEALSRGAAKCTFVDSSREAIRFVTENAQRTKLYQKSNVLCMDYAQYIKTAAGRSRFDLVFLDPPYSARLLPKALVGLYDADMLKSTSIIVCEDEGDDITKDEEVTKRFSVTKQARYGRVYIFYLAVRGKDDE